MPLFTYLGKEVALLCLFPTLVYTEEGHLHNINQVSVVGGAGNRGKVVLFSSGINVFIKCYEFPVRRVAAC